MRRELYMTGTTLASTPDTVLAEIRREHELAQADSSTAVAHAVRCGKLLLQVKAVTRHGEFMAWVIANTAINHNTANAYMRVARLDPANCERVKNLSLRKALAYKPTKAATARTGGATKNSAETGARKKTKRPTLTDSEYKKVRQVFINSVVAQCNKTIKSACQKLLGTDELQMLRDAVDAVVDQYMNRARHPQTCAAPNLKSL
jgi:Protein of unknown function (DUF3102)